MNKDTLKGERHLIKRNVREKWRKLSDDDLTEKFDLIINTLLSRRDMNKDMLKGEWHLVKGKVKEKWGKLSDDDLTEVNGKREQLIGKIQKKYGLAKDQAEQELSEWEKHSNDEHERIEK